MLRYQVSLDLIRKKSQKKKHYLKTIKKLYKLCFLLILTTFCFLIFNSPIFNTLQPSKNILKRRLDPQIKTFLDFSDLMGNLSLSDAKISNCSLPHLDPYDLSILPYIGDDIEINCENKFPVLFTSTEDSKLIQVVNPIEYGLINCCYRRFVRYRGSDNSVGLSKKCIPIVQNITSISPVHEFISISCQNQKTRKFGVVDMFGFVPLKPEVKLRLSIQNKKLKNKINFNPQKNKRVNIVVFGLDSISHMNFVRIMPKTDSFLKNNLSAIGMNGYTKIGDNTFPNAVAFLAGMNESQLRRICWPNKQTFLDKCPFIFKEFESQGYATSFAEDAPSISIFNYKKPGFNTSPVDYYLRPLTFLQDRLIGNQKGLNTNFCYGPRTGFDVLLEHFRKMAFTMQTQENNYFQFIWATSLFHDYLNLGKNGDTKLLESLEWFQKAGYFDNTVFILMSDHGMRWGPIRQTVQGRIEERMPFLYFVLPQWFRDRFPKGVQNLNENVNRLTTPFDLHETLKDLLYLEQIKDSRIDLRTEKLSLDFDKIPRGISLFLPISYSRKCDDAAIPTHFCVCGSENNRQVLPVDHPKIQAAAVFVVAKINEMLKAFNQCAVLKLEHIFRSELIVKSSKNISGVNFDLFQLDLELLTVPGDAAFEVTMESDENSLWKVQDITRTNLYGNQSRCVSDYEIKNFCYCY